MAVVNNKEQVTSFEDILEKIGGFGRWNWGMMFLSVLRYSLEEEKFALLWGEAQFALCLLIEKNSL